MFNIGPLSQEVKVDESTIYDVIIIGMDRLVYNCNLYITRWMEYLLKDKGAAVD
jgi:hypothetical protein